jgi:uncharacterized protein YbaR (Trm112 family)
VSAAEDVQEGRIHPSERFHSRIVLRKVQHVTQGIDIGHGVSPVTPLALTSLSLKAFESTASARKSRVWVAKSAVPVTPRVRAAFRPPSPHLFGIITCPQDGTRLSLPEESGDLILACPICKYRFTYTAAALSFAEEAAFQKPTWGGRLRSLMKRKQKG